MWLLNACTRTLESFLGSEIPEYTILSHTWEDEEVTFQDILQDIGSSKKGYTKIVQTCENTLKQNFKYTWIDTCCIDKTSSAELTESINSMYQWYQRARVCYTYLSDLPSGVAPGSSGFSRCRWFTRGWTLQELIAPLVVYFFDKDWRCIGSKQQFSDILSSITGINEDVLLGNTPLSNYPVAARMSWAAYRQTCRTEDLAYCLLGIFDVNMPLIYGEGPKAFRRLQEEIVKCSNDLTVFAWDENELGAQQRLFATSPKGFTGRSTVMRYNQAHINPVFAMTNKGLRMEEHKAMHKRRIKTSGNASDVTGYSLLLGAYLEGGYSRDIAIPLSKVGPGIFVRSGHSLTPVAWDEHDSTQVAVGTFYIQPDGFEDYHSSNTGQAKILHIPRQETLSVQEAIPQSHWDDARQLFFGPLHSDAPLVMAARCTFFVRETKVVPIVVCVKFGSGEPLCQIFNADEYLNEKWWLFPPLRQGPAVTWDAAKVSMPSILGFGNSVRVYVRRYDEPTISVSLKKGVVKDISSRDIYSLTLNLDDISSRSSRHYR